MLLMLAVAACLLLLLRLAAKAERGLDWKKLTEKQHCRPASVTASVVALNLGVAVFLYESCLGLIPDGEVKSVEYSANCPVLPEWEPKVMDTDGPCVSYKRKVNFVKSSFNKQTSSTEG